MVEAVSVVQGKLATNCWSDIPRSKMSVRSQGAQAMKTTFRRYRRDHLQQAAFEELDLQRNPSIVPAKSSSLYPKRAKAFSLPVVERYLDELHRLLRNFYNMDEKGCQRGGGKRGTTRKHHIYLILL